MKTTDIKSALLQGNNLEQELYLQPPKEANTKVLVKFGCEHTEFRSAVGTLNRAVKGTHMDKSFELVELSTKFKRGTVSDLIRVCKTLKSKVK